MSITITIPRAAKVFLVEDDPERIAWFRDRVHNLHVARSADAAIDLLMEEGPFDIAFLDHDLGIMDDKYRLSGDGPVASGMANSGYKVAHHIANNPGIADTIVIHSWNPDGARNMKNLLDDAVVVPFGQFGVYGPYDTIPG